MNRTIDQLTLTDLLREMPCSCVYGMPDAQKIPAWNQIGPNCARCQALARAEELERQLVAAHVALEQVKSAIGDRLLAGRPLSKPYAHSVMAQIDNALAHGTAALAAHDELVGREALEAAAKALNEQEYHFFIHDACVKFLRDRAKGCGNA